MFVQNAPARCGKSRKKNDHSKTFRYDHTSPTPKMQPMIDEVKGRLRKGEHSTDSMNKVDELQIHAMRQPEKLQEVLTLRMVVYFMDTFTVHDGKLRTTKADLKNITEFIKAFRSTIQTLIGVLLPLTDIENKDHALQVFAIAFTAYTKALSQLLLPIITKTYKLLH